MNAVEIEQAITQLAEQGFDPENFPFLFLEAFGNKKVTIDRLRSGSSNNSDIPNGVLQRNNIHLVVCDEGTVPNVLTQLKQSPTTTKAKAKLVLATDGITLEAEDLQSGETIACDYEDFPNHFGFFLPLAGISTVKQIRNNPIDIQATSRLNRLYVELNKNNETWANEEGRHNMNQFMTRLIFCFFAEDTLLFGEPNLFTNTVEQMTDAQSGNIEQVISEIFRAMDIPPEERKAANLPRWADAFPYVNGGLYAGSKQVPTFTRIARSYLLHAGHLDWAAINPDIFGSMIQAVADDEERGDLGMHYTSVPNILKVLNPLFLDDLREQLEQAGDNGRKLLNLRKRLSNIRVFDPACGSGNFLVIAYIQMREIEAEIVKRRVGDEPKSWIPLENFYGIEIKDFAAEVARLSLLIAEFQCDVRFIGQREATVLCLPLKKTGQIVQGNALQVDWLATCNSQLTGQLTNQEFFICGNPPFTGSRKQSAYQKKDLELIFSPLIKNWKNIDYVGGWFVKAAQFSTKTKASFSFVSTNSLCQGQQIHLFWPLLRKLNSNISFAYRSFSWKNLAQNNAGVNVIILGFNSHSNIKKIFSDASSKHVTNINPYLTEHYIYAVQPSKTPLCDIPPMDYGVYYSKSKGLLIDPNEKKELIRHGFPSTKIKKFLGSDEFIKGKQRFCLWLSDDDLLNSALMKQYLSKFY